ncbi:MAG TPA: hypothetical protein VN823_24290 [Stellaceae bacterium]|nr:hypothetical protein [Stellaceae bacterium]
MEQAKILQLLDADLANAHMAALINEVVDKKLREAGIILDSPPRKPAKPLLRVVAAKQPEDQGEPRS